MNLDALSINNPFLGVMIGYFNALSSNQYFNDIISFEDSQVEFLASQFAMSQVIKEPSHILDNFKSCIDLIFTSQPNRITDSGVAPSLHSNCQHQRIYANFDLRVFYRPFFLPQFNLLTQLSKISKKLCDPLTSTKCYWSLLKTTLNGKKVPMCHRI